MTKSVPRALFSFEGFAPLWHRKTVETEEGACGKMAGMRNFAKFCVYVLLLAPLGSHGPVLASTSGRVIEAMMARVGEESVRYSDLVRYKAVVDVLHCVGLRIRAPGTTNQTKRKVLEAYIDEELLYLEARARLPEGSGVFPETVRKIRADSRCSGRWRSLGERYGQAWRQKAGDLAGESLLVRELEKRLLVDKFVKERLGADARTWLQEARVRTPVKIFTE